MKPLLKNTAPGLRQPGGGQDKAHGALNSRDILPYPTSNYNLENLLPVATNSYTSEDVNRVKNAVICYCLAMADGDTSTMTSAADLLQTIAIKPAQNEYAHIHNWGRP